MCKTNFHVLINDIQLQMKDDKDDAKFPSVFSYDIEITSEVTGRAPTPELTIGVKQSGNFYSNKLFE